MNSGANSPLDFGRAQHRIVTSRNLQPLLSWGAQFASEQSAAGRSVMWAPCHALAGAVSLRTWILHRSSQALGAVAEGDSPMMISGAADVIIIVDPDSSDDASLNWLSDLLACAETAANVIATPPLPELVVLSRNGGGTRRSGAFLEKMRALGASETSAPGREADLTASALRNEIAALHKRYQPLLAALALVPCPLELSDFEALSSTLNVAAGSLKAITSGGLFKVIDGFVVPGNASVRAELRASLTEEVQRQTAALISDVLDVRLDSLPDARIEILMLSGDDRRATSLARRRFDEHVAADRFEEALRVLDLAGRLGITIDNGRNATHVDEAATAAMHAEIGNLEVAREMVQRLSEKKTLYRSQMFIEWLALAARTLAIKKKFPGKTADSLVRRAIRLAGDDLDRNIRLTLLRVEMLDSEAFDMDDRASWLLTHVNNKMLKQVSPGTVAAFLETTARRKAAEGNYRGALKRLRRMAQIETSDSRRARALLLMSECRVHFNDQEGAARYAATALRHALRAADIGLVTQAVEATRETIAAAKAAPAAAKSRDSEELQLRTPDALVPPTSEVEHLFEVMQSRFGALAWLRRRGAVQTALGDKGPVSTDSMSVYTELPGGVVNAAVRGVNPSADRRAFVLLRGDGDDLVVLAQNTDSEPRDESLVKLLLSDRGDVETAAHATTPSRHSIIRGYLERLEPGKSKKSLHRSLARLFNRDLLIYLEEQGMNKEEMADHLGISRATLYRMYARAGLN